MPTLHHWLTSTATRTQHHAVSLDLRLRAAADLRILARHRQEPPYLACEGCGYDDSLPLTKNISDCPELLDMAAGYGLTPETIATLDRPTTPKPDPDPADLLRQAATRLRTHAMAPDITPHPWLSMDGGDRLVHDPGHDRDKPEYVVDEPMTNEANAAWIALMHPGVGLALADWLAHEAAYQLHLDETGQDGAEDSTHALAVARAVLGQDVVEAAG
ncbi:hypothetical protein ACFC58_36340 [Kitasatospora purpeofusca]|uniref:hypothetical protein n=1 Tax=Kitasatospora purpeofusca TaxID=67352 RepID=UPI0035D8EC94